MLFFMEANRIDWRNMRIIRNSRVHRQYNKRVELLSEVAFVRSWLWLHPDEVRATSDESSTRLLYWRHTRKFLIIVMEFRQESLSTYLQYEKLIILDCCRWHSKWQTIVDIPAWLIHKFKLYVVQAGHDHAT